MQVTKEELKTIIRKHQSLSSLKSLKKWRHDNIENLINYILDNHYGELFYDVSFKKITTIKIGGVAKFLYVPDTFDSLIKVFKQIIDWNVPYFVIGCGSNLLVNDGYFEGILISLKKLNHYELLLDQVLMIEAGAKAMVTIKEITKKGIGNLEVFGTIPGTIGGLIYNNAGSNKKEIKDVLMCIDYLDLDGNIYTLKASELNFSYRYSLLKEKRGIILRAYFMVNHQGDISKLKENLENKKLSQPLDKNSFGSTFKNTADFNAWQIIKKLKLEKTNFNDARISEKHANFLINDNAASFEDMLNLINYIRKAAKDQLNYDLCLEVEVIDDFQKITGPKDKSPS